MPASRDAPGNTFGRVAAAYERGRPDWPAAAVDAPADELGLRPDATVLDLAAGTGKLTRVLVARFARVLAVEPDDEMRALVRGAETLAGTAEEIPIEDGSVDAVFVADAFHWFDGERALAEIARVLRPRGALVLLWSAWSASDWEPPLPDDARAELDRRFEEAGRPGGPRYHSGAWREAFAESEFEELRDDHVPFDWQGDRERAIALWLSVSSLASLSEQERAKTEATLRRLLPDGAYRLPMTADVFWTRLR